MTLRHIIKLSIGILTFIPGLYKWRLKNTGSGGTNSARYCYSVYLRHKQECPENYSVTVE
jgi:hypothetical protein